MSREDGGPAIQRHPDCTKPLCRDCLADAEALERELYERVGLDKGDIDILGAYRDWCDENGIAAQTMHGWPTAAVFDTANKSSFTVAMLAERSKP